MGGLCRGWFLITTSTTQLHNVSRPPVFAAKDMTKILVLQY